MLEVPGGRISVSDSVVRGLQLDWLPSGNGTWRFRYRGPVHGKYQCMRLGDQGVLSLAQARELARQHALRVAMGEDPCAAKQAALLVPTFEVFAMGAYLESIKTRKRSWGTDVSLLKNHVLAVIGGIRLDLIRPVDIRLLVDGLIRKGHAPSSRNRVLILVRFIINCAMRWKVVSLPENPCSGLRLCARTTGLSAICHAKRRSVCSRLCKAAPTRCWCLLCSCCCSRVAGAARR